MLNGNMRGGCNKMLRTGRFITATSTLLLFRINSRSKNASRPSFSGTTVSLIVGYCLFNIFSVFSSSDFLSLLQRRQQTDATTLEESRSISRINMVIHPRAEDHF